eukprot:snap_masked-scaffold_17-processed-gene-6.57-mRNA-1 protein AED:1.00 eAED:1.00 QI:0/-1/0/0/-1/1/1/0/397
MAASRVIFLFLQMITLTISFLGVLGSFIGIYSTVSSFTDYIPLSVLYSAGVLCTLIFFISCIGLGSMLSEISCLFSLFFYISGIFVCLDVIFLILFILYLSDVSVIPEGAIFSDTINNLEDDYVATALSSPEDFIKVQNDLDCCGIDMNSTYLEQAVESLLTGDRCTLPIEDENATINGLDAIFELQQNFPVFNETVQDLVDESDILGGDFFCRVRLNELNDLLLLILALSLFVIIFCQIISFICTLFILKKAAEGYEGSYYEFEDDNEKESRVERDFFQRQAADIGRVVIRVQTNLRSARFNSAFGSRKLSQFAAPFRRFTKGSFDGSQSIGMMSPVPPGIAASNTYAKGEESINGEDPRNSFFDGSVGGGESIDLDGYHPGRGRKSTVSTVQPEF